MNNSIWAALPLVLCLFSIMSQLLLQKHPKLAAIWQMVLASAMLAIAVNLMLKASQGVILTTQAGSWIAPFGISLVIDRLTALSLVVFSIIIWIISLYQNTDLQVKYFAKSYYLSFWFLILGVTGALTTGDLFNLYVWFEVMLISAFVLLSLSKQNNRPVLIHYVALNLIGTLCMLLAIAYLYGLTGSLNLADIAVFFHTQTSTSQSLPILFMLFFAIAVKAGLFPLYFWLPSAYPTPAISTNALFSGLMTKIAIIILIRLITLWPPMQSPLFLEVVLVLALLTMVLGVLGAAVQFEMRQILSFHIVSQIGYIVMGLAINTTLSLVAALYFLIHNIFVKTNLFLVSGFAERLEGTYKIKKLGDWLNRYPVLAFIFFITAFSLAGAPPLSGFWGKFLLIKSAIASHYYVSAGIAFFVSLMTLYSMIKIWNYVFCQARHESNISYNKPLTNKEKTLMYFPMMVLVSLSLAMALYPEPLLVYLQHTIDQLQSSQGYIQAVMGVNS